jgi:hypothetical protein
MKPDADQRVHVQGTFTVDVDPLRYLQVRLRRESKEVLRLAREMRAAQAAARATAEEISRIVRGHSSS